MNFVLEFWGNFIISHLVQLYVQFLDVFIDVEYSKIHTLSTNAIKLFNYYIMAGLFPLLVINISGRKLFSPWDKSINGIHKKFKVKPR